MLISKKIFVMLSSLAMVVSACRPAPVQQQPQIVIGVLAMLSGDEAIVERSGRMTANSAELAVQQINDSGGLQINAQTYRLVLAIQDDTGQPEGAVAAAQTLINQKKVVALIGPQFSKNAIPVAKIAERSGVPMISPMSTNPRTTQNKQFVFRIGFVDSFQGDVMARFAFNELNARNVAVLYDVANEYNRTVTQIFIASFTALGGAVREYQYTTGKQDFASEIQQITQQQPDVLFLPNYHNEVVLQISQVRQAGLTMPVVGTDSWGGLKAEDYPTVDGAFYASHWHVDSPQQQSQNFVNLYRTTYGTNPIPTAAMTYDAINLLADVIRQANTLDGAAIADALRVAEFNGVSGIIRYEGSGDPVKSAVILQIKDGELKVYKLYNP